MFTLSFIAQLATFPICLYYFGTFPTYFFIGNMFIVPLVSVITYAFGGIILAKLLSLILPDLSFYIYYLPVKVLQMLVDLMTSIIGFIEKLPLALIDHMKTSFLDLVLIYTIIVGFLIYLYYKKPRSLIITMSAILLFISIHVFENMKSIPDSLTVYNRRQATEIRWNTGRAENVLNTEDFEASYKLIAIKGNKALIVSSDIWKDKLSQTKFDVDNLILINDNSLSLYSLTQLFSAKKVVLDASLSVYTRMRLVKECKKLNIPCHDVVVNGAFSLNF